jgi:hypothetical protein
VSFSPGRVRIEGFVETKGKCAWVCDDRKHCETAISLMSAEHRICFGDIIVFWWFKMIKACLKFSVKFDRALGKAIIRLILH